MCLFADPPPLVPCALAACERASRWQEALVLLRDMQEAQLVVTGGTYTHVVKACTNAGQIGEAKALLEEMRENGMRVKQGTTAMVEKKAERLSAQRRSQGGGGGGNGGGFSPAARKAAAQDEATSAAAQPDGASITARPGAAAAAASWIDVLPPTTSGPPSEMPRAPEDERLRPSADEAATWFEPPHGWGREATTGDDAATATDADAEADADADAPPSVATATRMPLARSTAATRLSSRAAETLAARPRARSVKDFIRAAGSHSRGRRWSEILSDLDNAMADPNTKVQ